MSANDDDQLVADYLQRLRTAGAALPPDRLAELVEEITAHIAEARAASTQLGDGGSVVRNILERLGDPRDITLAAADLASWHGPGPAETTGAGAGTMGAAAGTTGAGAGTTGAGAGTMAAATGTIGGWPDDPRTGYHSGRDTGRNRPGALEIAAVILLLVGGLIVPFIGWVVGVVLLWSSPRWTRSDKWLGTLVWPGGLLAPVILIGLGGAAAVFTSSAQSCTPSPVISVPVRQSDALAGAASHGPRSALSATCTSGGGPNWLFIALAAVAVAAAVAGPVYSAIRLLRRAGQTPASTPIQPGVPIPA